MDGNDEKWLAAGGVKVDGANEEEENSLASNSSGSDSSFAESSRESSRVEVEDVTDEDCAERRFQAMEEAAAVTGGGAVNPSPIGSGIEVSLAKSGSGVEEAFTAREDEEFCEVSPLMREKGGVMYSPDRPPPIWDFLTVVTAFFVAVVAAYYTISVVEA